ncbi:hypothetical protein D0869_00836 [Hortaea werneckii]|uniref:Restriction of telomere capping protein 4 n=1 Tax=Hortaea werneckii TaxID=91943 RepID=A0A3M6XFA8_HORWE|nr:hypothetical protein KC324_g8469 [Hortaea werneckii]KAI7580190.1 hypothetical protein KC316_g9087 [Hortaea werneckii]RMX89482.1 hypothetical protein D0869_00836 [Hortaea werneckii]RMY16544.1 hypothetical protein D0868_00252 [Hortaea werneckii]
MPLLSRQSSRLLRQVDHKQHATQEDHQDPLKQYLTPPSSNSTSKEGPRRKQEETEEDIYADPKSSDDESASVLKPSKSALPPSPPENRAGFQYKPPVPDVDGPADVKHKAASAFQRPKASSADPSGKANAEDEAAKLSSDEGDIFPEPKRRKTGPKVPGKPYENLQSAVRNIHAPSKGNQPLHSKKTSYGRKGVQRREVRDKEQKAREEQRQKEEEQAQAEAAAKKPVFKRPLHRRTDGNNAGNETRATFNSAPGKPDSKNQTSNQVPSSPSLSSLSSAPNSPEVTESAPFHRPSSPSALTRPCPICNEPIPFLQHESFADQYSQPRTLTYQWQQRFCRYHRQQTAQETWQARGYPARIAWEDLQRRMSEARHLRHVRQVMKGQRESVFRSRLEERVLRKGGAETALQALAAEEEEEGKEGGEENERTTTVAKKGCRVGYYGPRGEKMMTTHILHTFTPDLRSLAASDKLLASAGVAGGVSGFVQAVLVPELALSLVSEDLETASPKCQKREGSFSASTTTTQDPLQVLEESAELGELLNPEVSVAEERSAGLRRRRGSEDLDEWGDEGGGGDGEL